jgi:hypothetical protein
MRIPGVQPATAAASCNTSALAVVDAALDITERVEGVDDVRELLGL